MTTPTLITLDSVTTAVVRGVVPTDELPAFFDRAFSTLTEVLGGQGVQMTGAAFGLYQAEPGDTADLEVGFPTDRPVKEVGDVVNSSLPGGRVARVVHEGSFDGLGGAWERLTAWIGGQGLRPSTPFWEVYLTEPSPDMDPADLRTELNRPVQA